MTLAQVEPGSGSTQSSVEGQCGCLSGTGQHCVPWAFSENGLLRLIHWSSAQLVKKYFLHHILPVRHRWNYAPNRFPTQLKQLQCRWKKYRGSTKSAGFIQQGQRIQTVMTTRPNAADGCSASRFLLKEVVYETFSLSSLTLSDARLPTLLPRGSRHTKHTEEPRPSV